MAKKQKFYVVWHGLETGVFTSWDACKKAIKGVKGAQYMSFESRKDALVAYHKEYADYKGKGGKKRKPLPQKSYKRLGNPICIP